MTTTFASILISVLAVVAAIIAAFYLIVPLFKGIGWLARHIFRFVFGMLSDLVRAVGGVITAVVLIPIILGNIVIGRWSAAGHFGRAFQDELHGIGHALYRVVIGHPARFFLLQGLTEGIEKRIPQAVAQSPGADKPSGKTGQFEGYTIVGSLPGGGSGGRLYVAEPDERKQAAFARAGRTVRQVVIKSFSLADGASLPQITRENRALEAAKKLGLILDHELSDARFFYVMEYIPGDSLTVVTKRLHSEAGPDGLDTKQLLPAISMINDLLAELGRYHQGGLWHKDVKPDNIIINQGRAFLVDLGLITPLRSAMTLTTHGTEYFRDPELVRMALRGAKVNEVDGVKFDLYGVGAVLYAVIENSFPAHGALSQITKRCPETLRWVVRRAMTDLSKRYASSAEMFADLRAIMDAPDAFAMRLVDLPSMRGDAAPDLPPIPQLDPEAAVQAGSPRPGRTPEGLIFQVDFGVGSEKPAEPRPASPREKPKIKVTDWWTGRYAARGDAPHSPLEGFDPNSIAKDASRAAAEAVAAAKVGVHQARRMMDEQLRGVRGVQAKGPVAPPGPGRTASEQLASAQDRVRRAQDRINRRLSGGAFNTSFAGSGRFNTKPNSGVAGAFFVFLAFAVLGAFMIVNYATRKERAEQQAAAEANAQFDTFSMLTDTGTTSVSLEKDGFDFSAFNKFEIDLRGLNMDRVPVQDDLDKLNALAEKVSRFVQRFSGKSRGAYDAAERAARAPAPPLPPGASEPPAPTAVEVSADEDPSDPFRGQVLLLNIVPEDMVDVMEPRLDLVKTRLASWGYTPRGERSSADDTELLAAGRRVVELSSPEDEDAVDRVKTWLNESNAGVDAVLWFGVGREGDVVSRLVTRMGFNEEALTTALRGGAAENDGGSKD